MSGEMKVDQFGPSVDIKISGRDQQESEWQDLKNDFVAVSTTRQIDSPAGAWALTLVSRRDNQGKTWAKRIRPMDYIEIRFGRYTKRPGQPPIVMRGFVDKLSETIGVSGDGKPQRQITISGRDFGKMLLIKQIYILDYTSAQALAARSAIDNGGEKAIFNDLWSHFITGSGGTINMKPQEFMDKVNDYIFSAQSTGATSSISGGSTGIGPTQLVANVPKMKFTAKDLGDAIVSPVALKTLSGPVWNLFQHYHSAPVCELIVHDTQDAPELLWRWAPFKDQDGKIISPSTDPGKSVEVDADEIMQYSIETTDNDLFNYYFTFAQPMQIGGFEIKEPAVTDGNPTLRKESINRYGFKPLEIQFALSLLHGHPIEEAFQQMTDNWRETGKKVSQWADKAYSHAARLEGGVIVMRGDERLDIGTYMKIKQTTQEFYVQGLRHDFTLNPPRFTTTATVSRGLWLRNNPYPTDEGDSSSPAPTTGGTGTADPLLQDAGVPDNFGPPTLGV